MELELIRTYFPNGTNGEIRNTDVHVCFTIELPWKNNQHAISCIPEGKYELVKRYNEKFGAHFMVMHVLDRDMILVHPANNAVKELKGCIAPVSIITGEGLGDSSRIALQKLAALAYPEIEKGNQIFLTIKRSENETTH
jgi:hypothetical protein